MNRPAQGLPPADLCSITVCQSVNRCQVYLKVSQIRCRYTCNPSGDKTHFGHGQGQQNIACRNPAGSIVLAQLLRHSHGFCGGGHRGAACVCTGARRSSRRGVEPPGAGVPVCPAGGADQRGGTVHAAAVAAQDRKYRRRHQQLFATTAHYRPDQRTGISNGRPRTTPRAALAPPVARPAARPGTPHGFP